MGIQQVINYGLIRKEVEKSKYLDGFDAVMVRGKKYYAPNGKYNYDDEYRNLAILASTPYIQKIANIARTRYIKTFNDNNFMNSDDFFQDMVESLLSFWHMWKPDKFKLTTMIYRFGVWWIFGTYNFRKVAKRAMHSAFSFMDEEGLVDFDTYASKRFDQNDAMFRSENQDTIQRAEDKMMLDKFLQALKNELTPRQYRLFYMRKVLGWSMSKCGKKLGISKERIRQIETGTNSGLSRYKEALKKGLNEDRVNCMQKPDKFTRSNPAPQSIQGQINKLREAWGI